MICKISNSTYLKRIHTYLLSYSYIYIAINIYIYIYIYIFTIFAGEGKDKMKKGDDDIGKDKAVGRNKRNNGYVYLATYYMCK